jgi:hypothetical protein
MKGIVEHVAHLVATKRRAPRAARSEFLGEATGDQHYEIKTSLGRALKGLPNVRAAYLARVADGSQLVICVRTEVGYDECVIRAAGTVGAVASGRIIVRFIDERQERELRRICAPFYAGMA